MARILGIGGSVNELFKGFRVSEGGQRTRSMPEHEAVDIQARLNEWCKRRAESDDPNFTGVCDMMIQKYTDEMSRRLKP